MPLVNPDTVTRYATGCENPCGYCVTQRTSPTRGRCWSNRFATGLLGLVAERFHQSGFSLIDRPGVVRIAMVLPCVNLFRHQRDCHGDYMFKETLGLPARIAMRQMLLQPRPFLRR